MQEQSGNRNRSVESKTGIPVSEGFLPEVTKLKEQELARGGEVVPGKEKNTLGLEV